MFDSIRNGWILYLLPAVLMCITIHEFCHGWVAMKLGDTTAAAQGRLTLNPIKHLDLFGFIMMLVFGFGFAKPVPVTMQNFKNPKRDMALVALAGPLSNLVTALVCFVILSAITAAGMMVTLRIVYTFFSVCAMLNVGFAVFNMIPVAPLDGSRILFALLPDKAYYTAMKYERFSALAIFVLLFAGNIVPELDFLGKILPIAREAVSGALQTVAALPFGL